MMLRTNTNMYDGSLPNIIKDSRQRYGGFWICLLLSLWLETTSALDLTFCSYTNTALTAANDTIYQSDGACSQFCVDNYAFAVLQFQSCWCTNMMPAEQVDISECNEKCPGYPYEICGSQGKNSFGYIQLPIHAPSGTQGVIKVPTSTVRTDDSSTPPMVVSSIFVSFSTTVTVRPSIKSSADSDESASVTSPVAESIMTTTPPPITSVLTIVGKPQTITITPTLPASPTEAGQHGTATTTTSITMIASSGHGFFSNTGRAAAVFTLIAVILVAIIALCFWFLLRRRRAIAAAPPSYNGEAGSPTISNGSNTARRTRSMSTLGLGVFSSEKALPQIHTSSPSPPMANNIFQPTERLTDQRLDPQQVWMRFENDNASRVSLRSLRDDQDYSRRVLKVSNPDDE